MIDERGREVKMHGINWFGFNNAQTMVDGLWAGGCWGNGLARGVQLPFVQETVIKPLAVCIAYHEALHYRDGMYKAGCWDRLQQQLCITLPCSNILASKSILAGLRIAK